MRGGLPQHLPGERTAVGPFKETVAPATSSVPTCSETPSRHALLGHRAGTAGLGGEGLDKAQVQHNTHCLPGWGVGAVLQAKFMEPLPEQLRPDAHLQPQGLCLGFP